MYIYSAVYEAQIKIHAEEQNELLLLCSQPESSQNHS